MAAPSFWNRDHPLTAQYEELYTKLVPASGNAETEEGEMLRAASRLGYDYYNNGMCNNTSGAAKFLMEKFDKYNLGCKSELQCLYRFSNLGGYTSVDLDPEITAVVAAVVDHITKADVVYFATNEDLFDWQDPDYYPEEEDQDHWGDD